jgi:hypothetical protein
LIGQSIRRLIQEGQTGKLKISLGKNFRDNSFIAIKNYNDSLVAIRKYVFPSLPLILISRFLICHFALIAQIVMQKDDYTPAFFSPSSRTSAAVLFSLAAGSGRIEVVHVYGRPC